MEFNTAPQGTNKWTSQKYRTVGRKSNVDESLFGTTAGHDILKS